MRVNACIIVFSPVTYRCHFNKLTFVEDHPSLVVLVLLFFVVLCVRFNFLSVFQCLLMLVIPYCIILFIVFVPFQPSSVYVSEIEKLINKLFYYQPC